MRFVAGFLVVSIVLGVAMSASAVTPSPAALYLVQSGQEGEEPFTAAVRIDRHGEEIVDGRPMTWWSFTARARNGARYGARILSDRVAMTSRNGPGEIARYLYRDFDGAVLEYRDEATDRALLPMIRFREDFLPVTGRFAAFDDGFASVGTFQGHTLVRVRDRFAPDPVAFDDPRLLMLRPDLMISAQARGRNDHFPVAPGERVGYSRPWTREELVVMIGAGVNFYGDLGDEMAWLMSQPVFYMRAPSFPDSFYRSNHYMGRMYTDEPSVRFGWDPDVPGRDLLGPEQHGGALTRRVETVQTSDRLRIATGPNSGALDLRTRNTMSWDTHYYSAWYQLAGGAPSITHEGRYRDRGFGWSPESFFGADGLDRLTPADQFHYINAFLRGAARAFDGEWGISLYPEGSTEVFPEACRTAYDMGARHLWYWISPPGIDWPLIVETARLTSDHARAHPRGSHRQATRAASVGIVLPLGSTVTPDGSLWGRHRDDPVRGGVTSGGVTCGSVTCGSVTCGDVAAAALSEAILCSRRGIPFDFLVDEPFVGDLGYDRLVYVRDDASLDVVPPWDRPRAPTGLELALEEPDDPPVAEPGKGRAVDYRVDRAAGIEIDGDFADWTDAEWIPLRSGDAGASDLVELERTIPNVVSDELWEEHQRAYLGFQFTQLTYDLRREFDLGDFHIIGGDVVDENRPGVSLEQGAIVVTEVRPGTPAAEAGLRRGDIIQSANGRETEWEFVLHGIMLNLRKGGHDSLRLELTRNDPDRVGYRGDLAADVAMLVDDEFLYLAADVEDDVQSQPFDGWYLWQGDCLQLGLSPLLTQGTGYSGEDHELGFALRDGGAPVVWRYHGRRGQFRAAMDRARIVVRRDGVHTRYEAAVPIDELPPLAPDLWHRAGFNLVVNDNDGDENNQRKGRLELVDGAMTRGKRTVDFAVMEFAPSPDRARVSAALRWRRRATPADEGRFRLVLAARSPETTVANVVAELASLDSPATPPARAEMAVPLSPEPREWSLTVRTDSPPGRYALDVRIDDGVPARARLPILIYP